MPRLLGLLLALLATAPAADLLSVSYDIDARLDEPTRTVSGYETVTVRNNSGLPLGSIWLHLHPNAFRSRRTEFAREMEGMENFDLAWASGSELGSISADLRSPADARLVLFGDSTEAELLIARPIEPGDSVIIELDFTTRVPKFFFERIGRKGRCYLLSHWYPMVAAYDQTGWYTGGVHPAGWAPGHVADYRVSINLPGDQAVAATGEPSGGSDERDWLTWPPDLRSAACDSVKTLRFSAGRVTGFAWVCSPDLVLRTDRTGELELDVLSRQRNRTAWLGAGEMARAVADSLEEWYGPAPVRRIALVDGTGIVPSEASFPGLGVVSQRPLPPTRLHEKSLARHVALQWFSPAAAPEPLGASWLSLGPAVHAEMRWLEQTYGNSNLLDLPFYGPLAGIGDEYYHRVAHYLAVTNNVLGSLAEPQFDYTTNPFSYSEARFSHAGRFFLMLERTLGAESYAEAIRGYFDHRSEGIGPRAALVLACSEAAGRDMNWFFDRWLGVRAGCDYALTGARRDGEDIEVGVSKKGHVIMPFDVEFRFEDGTSTRRKWDLVAPEGVVQVRSPKKLRSVELDPDRALLETGRWNNHWPRRVTIDPLFALPSFDAYQFFWGPYPWFDDYHGFQLGGWVQGRQFIDAGPLRGRHSWSASLFWATKLRQLQGGVWYQTPLDFISDRLRIITAARYSKRIASTDVILEQGLSPVLRQSGTTVQLAWMLIDLKDAIGRDPRAWDEARTSDIGLRLLHSYKRRSLQGNGTVYLGAGLTELGGQYDYWKASVEQVHTLRLFRNIGITGRLFLGALTAPGPQQAEFFLSGGLIANAAEPVSWAYEGPASGQEHWHYDADVNCRGWAGEYIHGRYAWGANLSLKVLPVVRPFLDIGNVADDPFEVDLWRPRIAAGIKLKLAWFYAAIPLWRWQVGEEPQYVFEKEWDSAKWMLGLNLAGFADF